MAVSPPQRIDLADYSGSWVVVEFWSVSCGSCVSGLPDLLESTLPYRRSGSLDVLLVNLDDSSQPGFAADYAGPLGPRVSEINGAGRPLPADALTPPKGTARQAIDWGISAVPAMYLVNPQGIIVAKHLKSAELPPVLDYFISQDSGRPPLALRCWVADRSDDTLALNIELGNPLRDTLYVEIDYRLVEFSTLTSGSTGRQYPEVISRWNPVSGSPEETLLLRLGRQSERIYQCLIPLEGHQGVEYRVRAVPESDWRAGSTGAWRVQGGEFYQGFPEYCREYAN